MKAKQKKAAGEVMSVSGPAPASSPAEGGRESAAFSEPSFEEIARRAHEIYLARGAGDGSADDDWLRAEQELRQARGSRPQGDSSG